MTLGEKHFRPPLKLAVYIIKPEDRKMDDYYDDDADRFEGFNLNEDLVPIGFDDCLSMLLQSIPNTNKEALTEALKQMVALKKEGVRCTCDQPMWAIGSAIAGKPLCNTCYIEEELIKPYLNYEIDEVCTETISFGDLRDQYETTQEPPFAISPLGQSSLFPIGKIEVSPKALMALYEADDGPLLYVARHQTGDWGEISVNEVTKNELGLAYQGRIRSVFTLTTDVKLCVITTKDRSKTMVICADEDPTE